MQTTRQTLDTGWRVREVTAPETPEHNQLPWLPAQVPGHVHLDLMRAGVIPDPFARLHERDVAWVSESDWEYETTFVVDGPVPGHAFLLFHGLDTVAEIALNGEPLGRTDNMYVPHEFPVDGRLRAGANHLRVTFRSALRVGRERLKAWGDPALATDPYPGNWDRWASRSFVRKAQYMFGWDWGPVLPSCGLWRPVELVSVPTARLGDWSHTVRFTSDGDAIVTIEAEVERSSAAADVPLKFAAGVSFLLRADMTKSPRVFNGSEADNIKQQEIEVPTGTGTVSVSVALTINNPARWQPNGMTAESDEGSAIYTLAMGLHDASSPVGEGYVDSRTAPIGLRTIELVIEPDFDSQGEGFKFRVNGHEVFIKGANWIPEDSFPSRLNDDTHFSFASDSLAYDESRDQRVADRIAAACDAGFNMLRVWGGGLYESEHFYELCDAHGILVWQDFPYACAYYPDTGEYAEAARVEATAAVRRIRNHPSLALWCGNNENQMMFNEKWGGAVPARFLGEHFYNDLLPSVVAAEDPQTPYWPGSPFGGPFPNSPVAGDCHNWDVWHGRGDWTHYTENDARFCSEFGFAASCGLRAWDTVLAPEDRHPQSLAVRWHDKTRKGYDTYLGYIGLHFPDPQTLEDLVYYSQLNQAEALKYGVEHYRRRKGHCWGTLFWQINDCWPVQSWAVIDSEGEPKAAYYACRKFYAPVLVSLVQNEQSAEVHLVSDRLHALAGTLTLTLQTFDGETLAQETQAAHVGHNGAERVASFGLAAAQGRERDVFLYAQFISDDGREQCENFLFLAEPKDWRASDPGLNVTLTEDADAYGYRVSLFARRFAPYAWLRRADDAPLFPGTDIGDNFFHLRPGGTRELFVPKTETLPTLEALRGQLMVRTL